MPEERKNSEARGHSYSHGGRRRRLKHRLKRLLLRRRYIFVAFAIILFAAVIGYLFIRWDMARQASYQIDAGELIEVGVDYRNIVYEGKTYRYNNRVTAILYAGLDSEEPIVPSARYTAAPRADSISLVIMDELNKRTTIIALNRDTMTAIRKYTVNGYDRGQSVDHLCYAYTYGNGGKVSARNLCEAVSNLMFGIPISGYVISNRAWLDDIADAIGPLEVIVPNNELEELGFNAGETAIIDSSNLEAFIRSRDTSEHFTNAGRMERQQTYINGAMDRIVTLLTEHPSSAWETLEQAEDSVLTNITRSRYLDLIKVLKNTSYSDSSYYILEGEYSATAQYDEFHPDMEKLQAKVIELFYIEG